MSDNTETSQPADLVGITASIVSAYVANNAVRAPDLAVIIGSVHAALSGIADPAGAKVPETREPAIPVRKSVTPDYIISLEDGRPYKSLKRHLALLELTPQAYRAKWNLPADYPMVAPNYAKMRSEMARSAGFGRKNPPEPSPKASSKAKASARPTARPGGRAASRKAARTA